MDKTSTMITVQVTVNAPIEKVWKIWATSSDIMQWNNPSDNWHSPKVENDLQKGGRFLFRMETKDGKDGFDHTGVYDEVIHHQLIEYTGTDGRRSIIRFVPDNNRTVIEEEFEPGKEPSLEIQKNFCQSVLNNFKRYAEEQK